MNGAVLVTGASGFIGQHVVRRLAANGQAVVASGRDAAALARLPAHVPCRRADLAEDDLDSLLHGCQAVVHAAALSRPWGPAAAFERANALATARLLAAARRAGVRRFVHFSSPTIYFRYADQYQRDESFEPPRRWVTHYACSKWAAELAVREAAAAGLPAVVLRPRAVFGPGDQAIMPRLLAVARTGRFPLPAGGRAWIDVTAVENVVDATLAALQPHRPGDGRAYNLSNGEPLPLRELLHQLFQACSLKVRLQPVPRSALLGLAGLAELGARLRPGQPEPRLTRYGIGVLGWSQTLDISRARRELDYVPRVSLSLALQRFGEAWRRGEADGR